MKFLLAPVALTFAFATPVVAQEAPRTAQFEAGGTQFEVTVPDGYCVAAPTQMPSGKADLLLIHCGDTLRQQDFFAVSRRASPDGLPTTRERLFAQLKPLFNAPDAEQRFAALSDNAMRDRNVDFEGGWKPMGIDDTCAYIGAQVATDRVNYVQGICMTVIGAQAFAIYSTSRGATVEDLANRIHAARALAIAIRPVSPPK